MKGIYSLRKCWRKSALLNYKMDSENPLALILAGQTELWEKLRLQAYRAILHRVDIQCFLMPYEYAQTKAYIEKQLTYAGHPNAIFSEDAMKAVHSFSSGIPRLINRACTQSLVYAYQNRRAIIDDRMVQLVLEGGFLNTGEGMAGAIPFSYATKRTGAGQ